MINSKISTNTFVPTKL